MLAWSDGVECTPDRHEVREIVRRHVWSSSLWISKSGIVWRKIYNPMTGEWTWIEGLSLIREPNGDRKGLNLDSQFIPIEHLICLAWRRREPGSATKVYLQDGKPMTAKYLSWAEEDDADERGGPDTEEVWRPLRGKKIGLVPIEDNYQISSRGRLRNPQGRITQGHYYDDRMWAAIANVGMLDLTSAAKGRKAHVMTPAIKEAMDALACGVDPADFADHRDIKETSAWAYYTKAAQHLKPSDLRHGCREIVPSDLWDVLTAMKRDGNPLLGESLTDLMEEVEEELPDFSEDRLRFDRLRLARMGIMSNL